MTQKTAAFQSNQLHESNYQDMQYQQQLLIIQAVYCVFLYVIHTNFQINIVQTLHGVIGSYCMKTRCIYNYNGDIQFINVYGLTVGHLFWLMSATD